MGSALDGTSTKITKFYLPCYFGVWLQKRQTFFVFALFFLLALSPLLPLSPLLILKYVSRRFFHCFLRKFTVEKEVDFV